MSAMGASVFGGDHVCHEDVHRLGPRDISTWVS